MFFLSSIENHKVRKSQNLTLSSKFPNFASVVADVDYVKKPASTVLCRYNDWIQMPFRHFLFSIPFKEHFTKPENL